MMRVGKLDEQNSEKHNKYDSTLNKHKPMPFLEQYVVRS